MKSIRGSIELDVAVEPNELADFLVAVDSKYVVTSEIVTLRGPGGGWPVVRFSGAVDAVSTLVNDYDDGVDLLS